MKRRSKEDAKQSKDVSERTTGITMMAMRFRMTRSLFISWIIIVITVLLLVGVTQARRSVGAEDTEGVPKDKDKVQNTKEEPVRHPSSSTKPGEEELHSSSKTEARHISPTNTKAARSTSCSKTETTHTSSTKQETTHFPNTEDATHTRHPSSNKETMHSQAPTHCSCSETMRSPASPLPFTSNNELWPVLSNQSSELRRDVCAVTSQHQLHTKQVVQNQETEEEDNAAPSHGNVVVVPGDKEEDASSTSHHQEELAPVPLNKWKQDKLSSGGSQAPPPPGVVTISKNTQPPLASRFNYASMDCGAKVIETNPEASEGGKVLTNSRDEYFLSPCNVNRWIVIELCEYVGVDAIRVANYEFFSSTFKDIEILGSNNNNDWVVLRFFTAKNVRELQDIYLEEPAWFRYIRINFLTSYGTEFYCPVSVVKIYGVTVAEQLEKQMEVDSDEVRNLENEVLVSFNGQHDDDDDAHLLKDVDNQNQQQRYRQHYQLHNQQPQLPHQHQDSSHQQQAQQQPQRMYQHEQLPQHQQNQQHKQDQQQQPMEQVQQEQKQPLPHLQQHQQTQAPSQQQGDQQKAQHQPHSKHGGNDNNGHAAAEVEDFESRHQDTITNDHRPLGVPLFKAPVRTTNTHPPSEKESQARKQAVESSFDHHEHQQHSKKRKQPQQKNDKQTGDSGCPLHVLQNRTPIPCSSNEADTQWSRSLVSAHFPPTVAQITDYSTLGKLGKTDKQPSGITSSLQVTKEFKIPRTGHSDSVPISNTSILKQNPKESRPICPIPTLPQSNNVPPRQAFAAPLTPQPPDPIPEDLSIQSPVFIPPTASSGGSIADHQIQDKTESDQRDIVVPDNRKKSKVPTNTASILATITAKIKSLQINQTLNNAYLHDMSSQYHKKFKEIRATLRNISQIHAALKDQVMELAVAQGRTDREEKERVRQFTLALQHEMDYQLDTIAQQFQEQIEVHKNSISEAIQEAILKAALFSALIGSLCTALLLLLFWWFFRKSETNFNNGASSKKKTKRK